jgi:hypothetical protein
MGCGNRVRDWTDERNESLDIAVVVIISYEVKKSHQSRQCPFVQKIMVKVYRHRTTLLKNFDAECAGETRKSACCRRRWSLSLLLQWASEVPLPGVVGAKRVVSFRGVSKGFQNPA